MSQPNSDGGYKSKLPRRQLHDESLPKYLPKAYTERYKLYAMHFCFAFISRMWDMSIVLLLADITNNSLFLVAVAGFLASLSVFLFMPIIGHYLDSVNRLTAVQMALSVKIIVLSVAYLCCGYLTLSGTVMTTMTAKACLYTLPVLCALAGLSFSTVTQCIEKDWVVVLSDGDSAWLSSTNSIMSQLDLGCASLAPAVTGVMFEFMTINTVTCVLLVSNAMTTFCLLLFMRALYRSWSALAFRVQKPVYLSIATHTPSTMLDDGDNDRAATSCVKRLSTSIKLYLFDFLHSGCAGIMVSYAFLYLTVLSFGSLMTVYLRWAGLSVSWIGVCRGLAALTGFAGALGFPIFNSYFGLYRTAQLSILYQCSLVSLAASSFFWAADRKVTVVVVVVSVLLSRAGLWMFDLSVRQIAQETIPEGVRGRVNGQWKSLTAFFEMFGYALAALIPDPQDFWVLTSVSAGMVLLAAVTYTLTNPFSPCRGSDYSDSGAVRSALGGGEYEHLTSSGGHHDEGAGRNPAEVEMRTKNSRYSSGGTYQQPR